MRVDINSRPAGLDDPLVVALPEGEFLVLRGVGHLQTFSIVHLR